MEVPIGRFAARGGTSTLLWDLEGPPDAEALKLYGATEPANGNLSFDPSGEWLARADGGQVALWPVGRTSAKVLRGHSGWARLVFTPDSRRLASASSMGPSVCGRSHRLLQSKAASSWTEGESSCRSTSIPLAGICCSLEGARRGLRRASVRGCAKMADRFLRPRGDRGSDLRTRRSAGRFGVPLRHDRDPDSLIGPRGRGGTGARPS